MAVPELIGKKILLVIASTGYQPMEYEIPKHMLSEVGLHIITASDKPGGAVASDGSTTTVDITLDKVNITDYKGIFFVGGPGALKCLDNSLSYHLIAQAKNNTIPYGAICISPRILAKAGALEGLRATGWDEDHALQGIFDGYHAKYITRYNVIIDGYVVTAKGPFAAKEFAESIIEVVTKKVLSEK